jgi:hypothetical protein
MLTAAFIATPPDLWKRVLSVPDGYVQPLLMPSMYITCCLDFSNHAKQPSVNNLLDCAAMCMINNNDISDYAVNLICLWCRLLQAREAAWRQHPAGACTHHDTLPGQLR